MHDETKPCDGCGEEESEAVTIPCGICGAEGVECIACSCLRVEEGAPFTCSACRRAGLTIKSVVPEKEARRDEIDDLPGIEYPEYPDGDMGGES